jgi:NAD-dependent SIR2 family protein deacetylase
MIIVSKHGSFLVVYCPLCAWRSDAANSWQEAETLRSVHVCPAEPKLRLQSKLSMDLVLTR